MAAQGSRQGIQGLTSGQDSKFTSLCSSQSLSKHIFNWQKTIAFHSFATWNGFMIVYIIYFMGSNWKASRTTVATSMLTIGAFEFPWRPAAVASAKWNHCYSYLAKRLNGGFICPNSSESPCLGVLHYLATNSSFMSHLKHFMNIFEVPIVAFGKSKAQDGPENLFQSLELRLFRCRPWHAPHAPSRSSVRPEWEPNHAMGWEQEIHASAKRHGDSFKIHCMSILGYNDLYRFMMNLCVEGLHAQGICRAASYNMIKTAQGASRIPTENHMNP